MLPLALPVPLALVSLGLVVPWPSASDVGLLPVRTTTTETSDVPSDWAPDAEMSRRLSSWSSEEDETVTQLEEQMNDMHFERSLRSYYYHHYYYYHDEHEGMGEELGKLAGAAVGVMAASALISLVVCVGQCIFACQYKDKVTERRPPLQDGSDSCTPTSDFAIRPFSCFDDGPTCIHAWCCMCCRAADTYQGAGIEQYWMVVFYFIGAGFVGSFVGSIATSIIFSLFVATVESTPVTAPTAQASSLFLGQIVSVLVVGAFLQRYRRKLRTRLGGREEGGPNIFVDVLLYGFCTCCVVAQEARELDTATGVEVECCCKLISAATGQPLNAQPLVGGQPQPLVGQPVYGHVA